MKPLRLDHILPGLKDTVFSHPGVVLQALALDIQQNLREDLKLLVMSATIETAPVAALLGDAPVIKVDAETFPVAEHFLFDDGRPGGRAVEDRLVSAVRRALR